MNRYQKRLVNEWIQHGKIIVSCDFDGTLSAWENLDNSDDIKYAIKVMRLCKEIGCYLTINTACNSDRFDHIRKHCADIGLAIDSINSNPIKLPFGHFGKVYANVYVDDRALAFIDGLKQLEDVAYFVRATKHSTSEQQVDF